MRTSPRHSHEPFLPPPTSFILLFSSPLHSKDLFPLPPRIPLFSLPASARFDPGHIRFVLPPISMALCGVPLSGELLLRSGETRLFSALSHSLPMGSRKCGFSRARCFAGEKATAGASSSGLARGSLVGRELVASEEEGLDGPGPVMKFDASDFELCDRVSVGLAGRADEVIFEAVVNQPESPLFNKRVVLRRLTTLQAQRRGRRALEVLKRLARRQLMYHSYAMRVHGYFSVRDSDGLETFTLVHRYHGSYSLRHWLQLSDWLPTLEATLALDEEWVRRVGDDRVGGSAVTRQLRLTRILMRDLLIGVNYLHSHGLAHTELRLENVHICPVDKHVKVGILGNAADFYNNGLVCTKDACADRRQLMIAYDMRCVGFMMAKMVFRELMDAEVFGMFKSFLNKGGDPSCLREFLLPMLSRNSPSGSPGLQMMDRNWGAGWNLLSLLLATKPPERISCLDALRHPFLCGPRWRVDMSMDVIRWGLGSTVVRIAEEYIYGMQQRSRMAHFIELMEMLNPHTNEKEWQDLILGRWRLLYSTGRHIGLTLRQGNPSIIIGNSFLTFTQTSIASELPYLSLSSNVTFKVIPSSRWPHDKSGTPASLHITSPCVKLSPGRRIYLKEETHDAAAKADSSPEHQHRDRTLWGRIRHQVVGSKEPPFNLPVVNLSLTDFDIALDLGSTDMKLAEQILRETRLQIPPEMFDVSKLVCGTYIDSRLMIIRGVNGSALLFTRS